MKNKMGLPRNVRALSLCSFFTDVSTEVILNVLPLYLTATGVSATVIGLIEGVAESAASLLKMVSGRISDRIGSRKWPAVAGYTISAFTKPLFYFAQGWLFIALVRWTDRLGKGVRGAPRDALLADSIEPERRGYAFGFHRAADTAGAFIGILISLFVVWKFQGQRASLEEETFRTIVLVSIIPSFLAVFVLLLGTKDIFRKKTNRETTLPLRSLGKRFFLFLLITGLFDLGNFSDAFVIMRANDLGTSVVGILGMLLVFNMVYSLVSAPAGILSDKIGKKKMMLLGWSIYLAISLELALANSTYHVLIYYILNGLFYGTSYGTAKAIIADIVPVEERGSAYGAYNAVQGLLDLPASLIAGILWSGVGGFKGFGPEAPFLFAAGTSFLAILLLFYWKEGE